MALAIVSVPVLTGKVAEQFEAQAKKTYQEYLRRTSEPDTTRPKYEQGVLMVKKILAKAKLEEE